MSDAHHRTIHDATDDATDDPTHEAEVEGFAIDGISALIAVTQLKSSNANDEALASSRKAHVRYTSARRFPK